MPGRNDIHNDPKANTNGFDKNPQNIGGGRKKKIYTILKEKGYSKDDVTTAFGELAFYTKDELESVYADESKPIITRIIANQFFQALKNSDWSRIKEIMEHVIGKPLQSINQKIDSGKIVFNNISDKYDIDENGNSIERND
jgi:hypothetical protein